MRIVGLATTAVAALGALAGAVFVILTFPDARRYLRMRKM